MGSMIRQGLLIFLCLISFTCFADQFGQRGISNYTAGASGTVTHGCRYVLFDLVGYSGKIGNVTYSTVTKLLPVPAQSQDTLGDIPYTVTGGSLNILEER